MDIEKTMQFILDTQAKHEVAMQKHEEAIRRADERFARFREQTEERFRGLVDVGMSVSNNLQTLTHSVRELREAQASTDYKLNALIETVDKLVQRNGSH